MSVSGGADKATHHDRAISGKTRLIRERRRHCPLEAGLGGHFILLAKSCPDFLLQKRRQ